MAFRADESASSGFGSVKSYLVPRGIEAKERERSENKLFDIVERYGPVVEGYPSWHPLVTHHNDQSPATTPINRCGYKGGVFGDVPHIYTFYFKSLYLQASTIFSSCATD